MAVNSVVAALLSALIVTYLILFVWMILLIVARWRIFTKAGEKGWKALIPIYTDYTMYKISWETKYFLVQLIPQIAMWIIMPILMTLLQIVSIQGELETLAVGTLMGIIVLYVLMIIIAQISALASIIQRYNLSRSFGHGFAFTVGLVMLEPIFMLILGFGSSQYIGNVKE